jgi:branched-chain amino acid transport system substrate-binding protein
MAEAGGTGGTSGAPKSRTKVVLAILIALVVVLAGTTAYLALSRPSEPAPTTVYVIGVEIAVSGSYAADGPLRRDGAFLAINQMNAQLKAASSPVRFQWVHVDSGGTTSGAISQFESLVAAGIKVVVGPLSSAEVGAIAPLADSNQVVAISPSATAPRLALDDFVFRVAPNDAFQARALTTLLDAFGITNVAIMARDDDYGRGIANLTENIIETEFGGQVTRVMYSTTTTDYSADVGVLSSAVTGFPGGTATNTAVLLVAFEDDGIAILNLGRQDSALGTVRWFGSESVRRPKFIDATSPQQVKDFLIDRNLTGFFPSATRSPAVEQFEEDYLSAWGRAPSPYAYYSYDAAMIAMRAILYADSYDGNAIRAAVPEVGRTYIGASGQKVFDQYGDYAAADYRIWHVTVAGTTYAFTEIGTWFYESGIIAWD